MNSQHIALIRTSFAWIAPSADLFEALFDANLRALDPSLSRLLVAEMGEQDHQLIGILRGVIGALDRRSQLFWAIQSIGRRHSVAGICAEHYDTIGDALMITLEQCLGERLTPDIAAAWDKTYAALAETAQVVAAPALPIAA